MKPTLTILLQVALVFGGIGLYDGYVRSRRNAVEQTETAEAPAEPSATQDGPMPAPPVLEASGEEAWRAAMDRRLSALEEDARAQAAGVLAPEAVAGGDLPVVGGAGGPETPAEDPSLGLGAPGATPTEEAARRAEVLRRFRALLEAVERQRAVEKSVAQMSAFFDSLHVQVTPEQRKAILRTTLEYQGRWRELARVPAADERALAERKTAGAALLADYERSLRAAAPAAEVDLILQAFRKAAAPKDAR